MEIQGKVWGSTSTIFKNHNVQINRIEAKKGTHCSTHSHEHKFNRFFVESGKLRIRIWKNDYDLVDVTDLEACESTTVKPGENHRFEAIEDTVAYEIYWTELDSNDIVRKDCGGVD
jgi:mannose-6-phosphate isomerase-like protein (cupin superfamily)